MPLGNKIGEELGSWVGRAEEEGSDNGSSHFMSLYKTA